MGKKASTITLSINDRSYLEAQTRARTIQAQTVNRARILLLKADGVSIDTIADKVGMNRKNVMLCVNKYCLPETGKSWLFSRSMDACSSHKTYQFLPVYISTSRNA